MQALRDRAPRAAVLLAEQADRVAGVRRHLVQVLAAPEAPAAMRRQGQQVIASLDDYLQALWRALQEVQSSLEARPATLSDLQRAHEAMVQMQQRWAQLEL